MAEKKRPLKWSILLGCVLFITLLCLLLSIATYHEYRNSLYKRYEAYITDVLHYVNANIDVDDLKECLEAGEKSAKYEELQRLLDTVKDTHKIDFLYIIIPVHPGEGDNIMNVIAAMSAYEKEYQPENEVQLGGLTGDSYPAETAAKYYNARNANGIVFFEEVAEWGDDYTGIIPLRTSDGAFFAELCVDVPVQEIHETIRSHMLMNVILIVGLGILFTLLFIFWSTHFIVTPIQKLEKSVVGFATQSHGHHDLTMKDPHIHTNNEIESLASAVVKMADDIKVYVTEIVEAEKEAEEMRLVASEMSELANKDSLTGIKNKTAYDIAVRKIEQEISDGKAVFGVVMADLNDLKRINDVYGHDKGNEAICALSKLICAVYAHSPVFRIGGDEFVAIIKGQDYDNAAALAQKFRQQIAALSGKPWEKISAALGYAKYDGRGGYDAVFKLADQRMYEEKNRMKKARHDLSKG